MIFTGCESGSTVRPWANTKVPFVFQVSKSGGVGLSLNLVSLMDAGTTLGPVRSSQPRIGGPPNTVQSLAQVSLPMLLPSSHCSGDSRMSLPQQPSPIGQSAAVVHGVPAVVHLPEIVQAIEQGRPGPLLPVPRSHCSDGRSRIASPQAHSTVAGELLQIAGHETPGQPSHTPGSGRPLH